MQTPRPGWWIAGATACSALALFAFLQRYELALTIRAPVDATLHADLPVRARIAQRIDVRLDEALRANATLDDLPVPIDETLDVPLRVTLDVPLSAGVHLAKPLALALDVPVNAVLTERDLGTLHFDIPLDNDLFIDDEIEIDTVVPLDSHVRTALGITVPVKADIPIHMRVPIKQKVHVKDQMRVAIPHFRLPLSTTLHVATELALPEPIHVSGRAQVPIDQHIRVPLRQTLHPKLKGDIMPVTVRVSGSVPAQVSGEIETSVRVDQTIATQLGVVRVGLGDIALDPKARKGR